MRKFSGIGASYSEVDGILPNAIQFAVDVPVDRVDDAVFHYFARPFPAPLASPKSCMLLAVATLTRKLKDEWRQAAAILRTPPEDEVRRKIEAFSTKD